MKRIEIMKKKGLFADNEIGNMEKLDMICVLSPNKKGQMSRTAS